MRAKPWIATAFLVGMAWSVLLSGGCQPSTRVLLIGNSYTAINGGIDKELSHLAPSIQTSRIAPGGYTLKEHWADGIALQSVHQGGWAYVVLQDQSQAPVINPAEFREYVGLFNHEITNSGARTILLMTWERPDSVAYGVTTADLAAAYRAVGTELGIKVAPVGLAFADARLERPDLVLCQQDGHPTVYGTYLAACVLYGTILDRSPIGLVDARSAIPPDVQATLQNAADQSLGY